MKRIIYVPIIHSSADLGSLSWEVNRKGVAALGEDLWQFHQKTIDAFWDVLTRYFDSIDVSGVKIYQDGMVADGEIGEKIIEEGMKSGSRNYQILSNLLQRGAILVKTEDFKLVKEERDRLVALTQARTFPQKIISFLNYKFRKNKLLHKRDDFIAKRIAETLCHGETGVLFIGASHNLKERLSKSCLISEIKDVEKVREYQRLLPFYHQNKERFEELGRYLVSSIDK